MVISFSSPPFEALAIILLIICGHNGARSQQLDPTGSNQNNPQSQLPPPPPAPAAPRPTFVGAFGGRGHGNPNVISIGAVLESQEAIAQFLQV